jgi:hypothetical protein
MIGPSADYSTLTETRYETWLTETWYASAYETEQLVLQDDIEAAEGHSRYQRSLE